VYAKKSGVLFKESFNSPEGDRFGVRHIPVKIFDPVVIGIRYVNTCPVVVKTRLPGPFELPVPTT
jgi:hypothetical protein